MFKQILGPLDGSVLAERLAQGSGATPHVVRVVDILAQANLAPAPVSVSEDVYQTALQETTTYLVAQGDRLTAAGLTVQAATPAAEVGAALLAYEREAQIDAERAGPLGARFGGRQRAA